MLLDAELPDTTLDHIEGPDIADLDAIEVEWPLIAAEMDLVAAEIVVLTEPEPTDLDWRRLRRAERRVLRAFAALYGRPATPPPAGGMQRWHRSAAERSPNPALAPASASHVA
jgi:hypothetical protein